MPSLDDPSPQSDDDCVLPPPPMPADELGRYGIDRDFHSEQDIVGYVERETHTEEVQRVERIKAEVVVGIAHVIWDVTTDNDRYWVITNRTNLYSQKYFPSLDYTLSFHVGLMMRMRSRPQGADATDPTPFDEVFRRQEQWKVRLDRAVEAEDFQAIGVALRECLLSLNTALRRQVEIPARIERPQESNFKDWTTVLVGLICPGSENKALRHHIRRSAQEAWQLVNWLAHDQDADQTATTIAGLTCDTLIGHFVQLLERYKLGRNRECPRCHSRNMRIHFDPAISSSGDYYATCGSCGWTSHPE